MGLSAGKGAWNLKFSNPEWLADTKVHSSVVSSQMEGWRNKNKKNNKTVL